MDDNDEKLEQQQHILNYCFSALEYVRTCDAAMFKRAKEYAEDQTGIEIDSFELVDKTDEVDEEGDDLYGFSGDEDEENE